jgi:hypothetical protein
MTRALAAVVLIAACGTPAETTRSGTAPGRGATGATPVVVDPGPPPPRDCTLLAPAIERIIAGEIGAIERDRPPDVAPIAIAEAKATGALLAEVLPVRCEADRWSGAYTACIALASSRDNARACEVHLDAQQKAALAEAIRTEVGSIDALGIGECDEWERITMTLTTCDKFPAESRQALAQGVKQTMDAWRKQALSEESRRSIAGACRAALDSIKQSMQSLGCAVDP